jgi:hypothetical protein
MHALEDVVRSTRHTRRVPCLRFPMPCCGSYKDKDTCPQKESVPVSSHGGSRFPQNEQTFGLATFEKARRDSLILIGTTRILRYPKSILCGKECSGLGMSLPSPADDVSEATATSTDCCQGGGWQLTCGSFQNKAETEMVVDLT